MTERRERSGNSNQHPPNGNRKEITTPRDVLIEQWRNAPEQLVKYRAGEVRDHEGNILYEYSKGARLLILDQEVMDTCQTPWAEATVDKAFEALGNKKDVSVLERGFGMGIVATRIIQHLELRGGEYTVIELNKQVAEYAKGEWLSKQNKISKIRATSPHGSIDNGSNISFELIEGDAVKETERLAAGGRTFDIIVSDTYPLSDDERSINDLTDPKTLVKCLKPDGVFAFFVYHTGYQGAMNERQRNLVEAHFGQVTRAIVQGINPPPDYKYFQTPTGPLRELPVITCTRPRLQAAA